MFSATSAASITLSSTSKTSPPAGEGKGVSNWRLYVHSWRSHRPACSRQVRSSQGVEAMRPAAERSEIKSPGTVAWITSPEEEEAVQAEESREKVAAEATL